VTKGIMLNPAQSILPAQNVDLGFPDLLAFVRRRAPSIIFTVLVFLALGITYLALAPPEYSATASLVIDQRKVDIFGRGDVSAESSIQNAAMETEVQILTSNRVAEVVVSELGLLKDASFMQGRPGFIDTTIGAVFSALASPPESSSPSSSLENAAEPSPVDVDPTQAMERATSLLRRDLEVRRVGLSYAIDIRYTAAEPEQAARLANAVAQAYLDDKIKRQVNAATRLSEWLETRIADLRVMAFGSELRAEEKSAIRATYDSFIQRYTEAVQQQSVPEADALVITTATPPSGPSSPNAPLVLAAALVLGTALGSGIALGRELLDRKIRTRRQLTSVVQSPCLGVLPTFRLKRRERREIAKRLRTAPHETERTFVAGPWLSLSLRAPYSRFAETLRSTKLAADRGVGRRVQILGVVSAMPGEGKSTVAGNLARLIGATRDVLLIDADIRDPALSRYLVSAEAPGLAEVVTGKAQLADVVCSDRDTRLRFLPAGGEPQFLGSGDILGSPGMKSLLDEAREKFDFIVVDLPPLLPVVDVRAVAPLVDGFAFVVEWGATSEDQVSQSIPNGGIEGKVIGSIFNKVVLSRYRRFDPQAPTREANAYLDSDRRVG
jgi:Mrp family chromosome partitioning ATPase/capsular polysaccharide biosynthesis protein